MFMLLHYCWQCSHSILFLPTDSVQSVGMDIEDGENQEESCYCTVMQVLKHISVSVSAEQHIKNWGKLQDFGAGSVLQCSGWTLISLMRKLQTTIRSNFGIE